MAYAYVSVDLRDIDDDDLIDELESRGYDLQDTDKDDLNDIVKNIINDIWLKRRTNADFTAELDNLIFTALGKLI